MTENSDGYFVTPVAKPENSNIFYLYAHVRAHDTIVLKWAKARKDLQPNDDRTGWGEAKDPQPSDDICM